MKIKINNNELLALCTLVEVLMQAMHQRREVNELDIEEFLHLAIIESLWVDLQKKKLCRKDKYSVNLKAEQAICFYLQFNGCSLKNDLFTQNLVRQVCNFIHQQFQLPCNK